jgi:hypothetical protein
VSSIVGWHGGGASAAAACGGGVAAERERLSELQGQNYTIPFHSNKTFFLFPSK